MMFPASITPLVWPLLDKLNRTTAMQQRPKVAGNLGLMRLPTLPWDDSDRPGAPWYGQVEGAPRLWDLAPWRIGLCALRVQSTRLQDFKNNPRTHPLSEEAKFPAVVHSLGLWNFFPPSPPPRDDRQANRINWLLMRRLFFNPNSFIRQAPVNIDARSAVGGLVKAQQKPKAAPQRSTPVLPWDYGDAPTEPAVVHQLKPYPPKAWTISGVTKDSTGAVLGSCQVIVFRTSDNTVIATTTSDANGNYSVNVGQSDHYGVAYKAGSPDVAGTTVNTVRGS